MSIGVNIKKRRLELRMSQQELAEAMGYKTRSTIAKIESGENDVSQKKLQRFAVVLNTTMQELISEHAPAAPSPKSETGSALRSGSKNVAIILAGGTSGKTRQNIPSQFINVHGKPILVHCMAAYQAHPSIDDIYVVCAKGWENIVKAYADQYGIRKLRGLVPAGASGMLSLKNALDRIRGEYPSDTLILVQEATRPMVTAETISNLLQACTEKDSATICYSMREYVQFDISGQQAAYIDRDSVIALQSPEAHRFRLLQEVFEKARRLQHPLTESCCTMLLYHLGYDIHFLESSTNNIKIAHDEDLAAISALLQK